MEIFLWINPINVFLFEGLIISFDFSTARKLQPLYLILLFRLSNWISVLLSSDMQGIFMKTFNIFHLNCLSIRIILMINLIFYCTLLSLILLLKLINLLFRIWSNNFVSLIPRWVKYHDRLLRMRWITSIILILNWL